MINEGRTTRLPSGVSEGDVLAWVEGAALPGARAERFERAMSQDEGFAAMVEGLRRDRDLIGRWVSAAETAPSASVVQAAIEQAERAALAEGGAGLRRSPLRAVGTAAGLLVAGGVTVLVLTTMPWGGGPGGLQNELDSGDQIALAPDGAAPAPLEPAEGTLAMRSADANSALREETIAQEGLALLDKSSPLREELAKATAAEGELFGVPAGGAAEGEGRFDGNTIGLDAALELAHERRLVLRVESADRDAAIAAIERIARGAGDATRWRLDEGAAASGAVRVAVVDIAAELPILQAVQMQLNAETKAVAVFAETTAPVAPAASETPGGLIWWTQPVRTWWPRVTVGVEIVPP